MDWIDRCISGSLTYGGITCKLYQDYKPETRQNKTKYGGYQVQSSYEVLIHLLIHLNFFGETSYFTFHAIWLGWGFPLSQLQG